MPISLRTRIAAIFAIAVITFPSACAWTLPPYKVMRPQCVSVTIDQRYPSCRLQQTPDGTSSEDGDRTPTTDAKAEPAPPTMPETVEFTNDEVALIENLHSSMENDDETDETALSKALSTWPPKLIVKLRQSANHESDAIQSVARRLNELLDKQLQEGAETLKQLLDAGEIRKLDALIGKAGREGKLNLPFFNVLTLNLQDAAASAAAEGQAPPDASSPFEEGVSASRLQILQHIYTRCQEEVEKSYPPGTALLNKLLRTEQAAIRQNLYSHYLTPQPNVIKSPDGKEIELQGTQPILVSIEDFVTAIGSAVQQVRTVEQAGGTDRASAADMVEACRQVAKEARIVIGESFGVESDELRQFQEGLQPVFRPSSSDSPYIRGES